MKPTRCGFLRLCGPARGLAMGGLLFVAGCNQFVPSALLQPPPVARGVAEESGFLPPKLSVQAEPPAVAAKPAPPKQLPPIQQYSAKALPISLDTVLRLAHDQNGNIVQARERLCEAFAGKDLADKRWLPDVYLGTGYYRHEGGIQDFTGQLIHSSYGSLFAGTELCGKLDLRDLTFQKIDAQRKIWQKRGELAKLTSENLLDAASTYVDLLSARSGESIAVEMEKEMQKLLERTQGLAKAEQGARVEVVRVQSEIQGQQQIIRQLRAGTRNAAAKLIYLLGLDPDTELVPVDGKLVAFNLVDDTAASGELVERALSGGPGIREMSGLLALIDQANDKAQGAGRLLPVVQVNMAEGIFGAGPGSRSDWDNRWDLGVQVRWNLSEFLTTRERRRLALSKMQQAQLGYVELRAKLTLGVREAREASQSGRDQARFGLVQIEKAREAYELSYLRFINTLKNASASEVLLSIRGLGGAHLNYLNAVREHDKAQLRLFILTGQVDNIQAAD